MNVLCPRYSQGKVSLLWHVLDRTNQDYIGQLDTIMRLFCIICIKGGTLNRLPLMEKLRSLNLPSFFLLRRSERLPYGS